MSLRLARRSDDARYPPDRSIYLLVIPVDTSRRLTHRWRALFALVASVLASAALFGFAAFPALAAPRDGASSMMGVGPFGVAKPSADLRIKPVGVRGAGGKVSYTFRVSNAGPDTVTFDVATTTYARPTGTDHDIQSDGSSAHTLSDGQQVDVTVTCDTEHVCASAVAWIERVNGTDPNRSNNLAYVHTLQ
jgi:hypothetical protein